LHQHLRAIHLRWLEKLVRLQEARPNIAPRGLSREWHLPLAILLHLSDLVFNNNDLVDHVLEVGVLGVQQLELNVIIQPVQEHVMLLLNRVDVVRAYLDNWMNELRYSFTIMPPCFRSVNSFLFNFIVPRGT
jgi:hypothetical protein